MPIIFCLFDQSAIELFKIEKSIVDGFTFSKTLSTSGDKCHFDINGMSDKIGEKFTVDCFVKRRWKYCDDDNEIEIDDTYGHDFFSQAKENFEKSILN